LSFCHLLCGWAQSERRRAGGGPIKNALIW
jgi:hypothetical protein